MTTLPGMSGARDHHPPLRLKIYPPQQVGETGLGASGHRIRDLSSNTPRLERSSYALPTLALLHSCIVQVLWLLAFVAFVAAALIRHFFFGLFCARRGSSDFPIIYVWTSPLPVAVWTMFIWRWLSVRQWRREGRDLAYM